MSINWKRPKDVRYEQSKERLTPLFHFIFTELENSKPLGFNLYKTGKSKNYTIKKTYDVCLLISLYITKLIANLNTSANLTGWETSDECNDTELLMLRYFAFNKAKPDENIIAKIGKDRWSKIKVPGVCDGFDDDTKIDKIKANNFNKYMRSIPREMIYNSIGHLGYVLDKNGRRYMGIRRLFYNFFRDFINGMDIEKPKPDMYQPSPDNFLYYFNLCGRKFEMFWLSLSNAYPDKVEKRMYEVWNKRTKKQNGWTKLEECI